MKTVKIMMLSLFALSMSSISRAEVADELIEIKNDANLKIEANKAYFLFRMHKSGMQPNFMRIPSQLELDTYEESKRKAFSTAEKGLIAERQKALEKLRKKNNFSVLDESKVLPLPTLENFTYNYQGVINSQNINLKTVFSDNGSQRTYLIEALPGNYVFYGVGHTLTLITCLCLGSVSFSVEPGKIVDLGEIFLAEASTKSDIPELKSETGLGASINYGHSFLFSAAIKPVNESTPIPPELPKVRIYPAKYSAVGKFVEHAAFNINRLAPIPGVLAYENGQAVDVMSGTIAKGAQ